MRVNERTAIATDAVLLVPYEAHHVPRYHIWMQDADIREATASEELTLEEELENQQSWRSAHDKLTFILCEPAGASPAITAGQQDAEARMLGDVNFFLHPHDDDEDAETGASARGVLLRGEVDVMVAEERARGRGVGSASVRALLAYVGRHMGSILSEYAAGERQGGAGEEEEQGGEEGPRLVGLMVKIGVGNARSIKLFEGLGFAQDGGVDYFGEVKMVLARDAVARFCDDEALASLGYRETSYTVESP